jgi:hypothetical protein
MDTTVLAATLSAVVTLLLPYFQKTGEAIAEEAGKDVYSVLKKKFAKETSSDKILKNLKIKPNDTKAQKEFRSQMEKYFFEDDVFRKEIVRVVTKYVSDQERNIINSGDGAISLDEGVSAGKGGVAIKGNVEGNITIG